jgi:acyl-CoA reductase-like NAD-dependent aldehyde dehydrogenase
MSHPEPILISAVDGRELVRRPTATDSAVDAAVEAARAAQKSWRNVPLAERSALVLRFLDELLGMNQEVVP